MAAPQKPNAGSYKGPLDYIDVAARIVEFRTKYPSGSLQQHALDFKEFAGKSWVIYTATAYRTPEDDRPGMGTAWEPVPGTTNFTRDSELQNAETAAWGRAIVAALAADTKKGIASSQEVRNRTPDGSETPMPADFVARVAKAATIEGLKMAGKAAHDGGFGAVAGPLLDARLLEINAVKVEKVGADE
jgi:hypothetical protein